MRPVHPLHPPLGLRRAGGDQFDPQLRAHAPELGDGLFPSHPLLGVGRPLVEILPVHVERLRHPVALPPPPRSSLPGPNAPGWYWWHRRPGPSGTLPGLAPPARRESSRPSAPSPQSAPSAPAAAGVAASVVPDSTTLPPASSAATSPHPPAARPPKPNARPPESARNALLPARHTSLVPAPTPSAGTSRRTLGSTAAPHCG